MKMMPGWDGDVGEAYLFLDCNHLQLINLRKEQENDAAYDGIQGREPVRRTNIFPLVIRV